MKIRSSQVALLSAIAAVAIALFVQYRHFYHDDAYISLRYVRNFLDGHGLVWNPGERVEGYSNFLWVIIVAALGRVGLDLELATRILGVGSLVILLGFLYRYSNKDEESSEHSLLGLIPIAITASAAPVVIWSMAGLETMFFTLLLTVGVLLLCKALTDQSRSMVSAGVFFGFASLCRPDGLLFAAAAVGYTFASGWFTTRRFDRRPVGLVACVVLLVAPHFLWRYWYYGDWLPNTYYVKGPQSLALLTSGFEYLSNFALALPLLCIVTGVTIVWSIVKRSLDRQSGFLLAVILIYSVYVASVGGDHMPGYRLMVPIIPLGAVLLFRLSRGIKILSLARVSPWIVGLLVCLSATQIFWPDQECRRARVTDGAAFIGSIIGKWINANWPEGSLVALNTAGSTPYFAPELRFIDMLGLNDTTIARRQNVPLRTRMQSEPGHGKGDGEYILARRPDFVIIGPSNGDFINDFPWFLSDRELEESPEFQVQFEPVKVVLSSRVPGFKDHIETSLGGLRFVYYQRRK